MAAVTSFAGESKRNTEETGGASTQYCFALQAGVEMDCWRGRESAARLVEIDGKIWLEFVCGPEKKQDLQQAQGSQKVSAALK